MTGKGELVQIGRCLAELLRFRSAFAPFLAAVDSLGNGAPEPEERRQLLALWRPCQRRLDQLLDTGADCGAPSLDPLRQAVEDSLRDEVISAPALVELAAAFDQAGEALLLRLGEDLGAAVAEIDGGPI